MLDEYIQHQLPTKAPRSFLLRSVLMALDGFLHLRMGETDRFTHTTDSFVCLSIIHSSDSPGLRGAGPVRSQAACGRRRVNKSQAYGLENRAAAGGCADPTCLERPVRDQLGAPCTPRAKCTQMLQLSTASPQNQG